MVWWRPPKQARQILVQRHSSLLLCSGHSADLIPHGCASWQSLMTGRCLLFKKTLGHQLSSWSALIHFHEHVRCFSTQNSKHLYLLCYMLLTFSSRNLLNVFFNSFSKELFFLTCITLVILPCIIHISITQISTGVPESLSILPRLIGDFLPDPT